MNVVRAICAGEFQNLRLAIDQFDCGQFRLAARLFNIGKLPLHPARPLVVDGCELRMLAFQLPHAGNGIDSVNPIGGSVDGNRNVALLGNFDRTFFGSSGLRFHGRICPVSARQVKNNYEKPM